MVMLVKLQRRIRDFLDRKRAVRNYEIICPPELRQFETENVKVSPSTDIFTSERYVSENALGLRSLRLR